MRRAVNREQCTPRWTALVVALAAALLVGCGAGGPLSARTVTVTVTSQPDSEASNPPESATPATQAAGGAAVTDTQVASQGSGQASTPAAVWPTAAAREAEAFAEGFASVQRRLSGPASVALVPVGGGRVLAAGELETGVAWSTSKVPLAIAALRASDSAQTRRDVTTAIRDSDNPASARLWAGLGLGERAAAKVEAVLREAGDRTTQVPAGRSRPPYSSFGQMQWSTPDAAGFAARLPCLAGSGPVVAHMRRVTDTQQWGFWHVDGAAVKGGWGPVDGGYLVRQVAIVPVAQGGSVGAALLVHAPTFEEATADLDVIAEWAAGFAEPMGAAC